MTSVSSIIASANDPSAAATIVDNNCELLEDSEFSLVDSKDAADSKYSMPAQTVLATIRLGGRVADIAAGPERGHLYVAQLDSVTVVGSGHHIVTRIPVRGEPKELLTSPDGARLYVNGYRGWLSVIDTAQHTVRTITGDWDSKVAVGPDGGYIYAARGDGAGDSLISVIASAGEMVGTIAVAGDITALATGPDGADLYAVSI